MLTPTAGVGNPSCWSFEGREYRCLSNLPRTKRQQHPVEKIYRGGTHYLKNSRPSTSSRGPYGSRFPSAAAGGTLYSFPGPLNKSRALEYDSRLRDKGGRGSAGVNSDERLEAQYNQSALSMRSPTGVETKTHTESVSCTGRPQRSSSGSTSILVSRDSGFQSLSVAPNAQEQPRLWIGFPVEFTNTGATPSVHRPWTTTPLHVSAFPGVHYRTSFERERGRLIKSLQASRYLVSLPFSVCDSPFRMGRNMVSAPWVIPFPVLVPLIGLSCVASSGASNPCPRSSN